MPSSSPRCTHTGLERPVDRDLGAGLELAARRQTGAESDVARDEYLLMSRRVCSRARQDDAVDSVPNFVRMSDQADTARACIYWYMLVGT